MKPVRARRSWSPKIGTSRFFRAANNECPAILWVRVGNTDNRTLITQILRALPAIIGAIERGETVVEFVGR
jgi:predicted nuclease of predicted toxin-antitoxin system